MAPPKLKNDRFRKNRGGHARLLEIHCEKCQALICHYQKDGPGLLKRLYLDRIQSPNINITGTELTCPSCSAHLGTRIIYESENRPAFRLFPGVVTKKIIK